MPAIYKNVAKTWPLDSNYRLPGSGTIELSYNANTNNKKRYRRKRCGGFPSEKCPEQPLVIMGLGTGEKCPGKSKKMAYRICEGIRRMGANGAFFLMRVRISPKALNLNYVG